MIRISVKESWSDDLRSVFILKDEGGKTYLAKVEWIELKDYPMISVNDQPTLMMEDSSLEKALKSDLEKTLRGEINFLRELVKSKWK